MSSTQGVNWESTKSIQDQLNDIIENQGDPNVRNSMGQTPLHFAMTRFRKRDVQFDFAVNADVVRKLTAMGADPNASDDRGSTPLHEAMESNPMMIRTLLDVGANPNAKTLEGETPLHKLADVFSHQPAAPEMVRILLTAGADPNAQDSCGVTPLQIVGVLTYSYDASRAIIDQLLAAGADPSIKDDEGRSPLDFPFIQEAYHKKLASDRARELEARGAPSPVSSLGALLDLKPSPTAPSPGIKRKRS